MSWAIAALCMLAMVGSFWGTRRARFTVDDAPERGPRLLQQIAAALRNRPFRVLVGAYALQLCAVGSLLATVAYFAEYIVGGGEETVTLLFLALMLPAIVTMPLWLALSAAAIAAGFDPFAAMRALGVASYGAALFWIAYAVGREGREGKQIGTLFVR